MRKVLLVAIAVTTAACWSDKVTGSSTVFGTYTLRTVNGSSLPFAVSGSGTNQSEVVADTMFLYEGFTYAERGHYRNTVNGAVTTETKVDNGAFSLLGNSASFVSNSGVAVQTYVVEDDVIHVVKPGFTLNFKK